MLPPVQISFASVVWQLVAVPASFVPEERIRLVAGAQRLVSVSVPNISWVVQTFDLRVHSCWLIP